METDCSKKLFQLIFLFISLNPDPNWVFNSYQKDAYSNQQLKKNNILFENIIGIFCRNVSSSPVFNPIFKAQIL